MASCETCQYAYIDEFTGEPLCDLDLDEDEVDENHVRKEIEDEAQYDQRVCPDGR